MKDTERQAQLLSLWLQRPANKRTGNDLLIFYGELQRIRPELLKHGHGDPYQPGCLCSKSGRSNAR